MNNNSVSAALSFAFRESRAALKNFKIFMASLFLGTAIIAGVGSVTANIFDSISHDGRILLGGDVEISQIQKRLTKAEKTYLAGGGALSEVATLRSMAHVENDSSLVDLKAVDGAYPLYGELSLRYGKYTSDTLSEKQGNWGIVLSDALASRLELAVGDKVTLGVMAYEVRDIIKKEPDANNQGFQLAPGATIALDSLFENTLVKPGSLVRYYNRIKLNQSVRYKNFKDNIKKKFPDQGWRVRDSSSGGAGLRRFVSRMGQFMALVGLTALLVGGVGISNAIRSYLDGKRDTIATYKILGGTGRVILLTYLAQILIIASAAILLGLITGALLPMAGGELLKDSLPVDLNMSIYPKPLILAAFYSFLVAMIFTLWPLGKAVQVPAARLFRQTISRRRTVSQSLSYILVISSLAILLISTIIYMSEFRRLTAVTLGAAFVAFLILSAASALVKKIAKSLPRPKNPILHIALGNLYRPGNSTSSIVLSLGLGLILFTAIALIENNLLRGINDQVKGEAPSFFFIDIQKDRHDDFTGYLAGREGVVSYRTVPNLRGRITHIKSIDSNKAQVKEDGKWILRGDKGITFSPALPADNIITAGEWWPKNYDGPSQVSISQQMADSMDLGIGDEISVNILGRAFTLPISSIRRFSWGTFGINYVMMVDPVTLKDAPYTYVATVKTRPEDEQVIYRELYQNFPGISIVRMKELLENALALLMKISGAIDVMAAITIISGVLVLAGAIAAGHKARIYDAAVLKVVGATRRDILTAYIIEFILLGILTGVIAIILGSLAAYSVIKHLMEMSWQFSFVIPLSTVGTSIVVTLAFGMVSIWLAMSARPSKVLRNP
ncbi:MAG: glycosyl transferase family 1 [Alphaproteobacteria bacterium]|nr:MAG: glycosyl transferase family 1 [Alphaproteobacteria bacterium]